jgi:hypothetical protein
VFRMDCSGWIVGKPHLTPTCLSPDHVLIEPLHWVAGLIAFSTLWSTSPFSLRALDEGCSICFALWKRKWRSSDGLVSGPLPLFSRCLGALLVRRDRDGSLLRQGTYPKPVDLCRWKAEVSTPSTPAKSRVLARVLRFFLRVLSNDFECLA